ncbi:MAG: flagellar protein FliT [Betaproteobacteria bacterium]|nr:flagellar protein FliT [Betaproteobacteria bacterium]
MEELVISCYEAIARASSNMLAAAREADWQRLIEAEADCARHVQELRRLGSGTAMSEAGRRRRVAILRQVLAEDAEVRALTQPWLAQLERHLHGRDVGRRVRDTYR